MGAVDAGRAVKCDWRLGCVAAWLPEAKVETRGDDRAQSTAADSDQVCPLCPQTLFPSPIRGVQ